MAKGTGDNHWVVNGYVGIGNEVCLCVCGLLETELRIGGTALWLCIPVC